MLSKDEPQKQTYGITNVNEIRKILCLMIS